ncbi:MAG: hypothetical protein ACRDYA_00430 [Egibacteraceae bacterium]
MDVPSVRARTPKLQAQSKVYLVDPLLARLASLRQPALEAPGLDHLSQQQLGMALARQAEALHPGTYPRFENVLFHRSATRSEIDFVSPRPDGVPLESKYTDGPWRREAQTMRAGFRRVSWPHARCSSSTIPSGRCPPRWSPSFWSHSN